MRSKEHAHDYRYFPEPDLVPLRIGESWLGGVRAAMPELPAVKRARFIEEFGLREYDAGVLTATRAIAEYFEKVAAVSGDPQDGRQLGDGRPDGAAQGRGQGDRRVAGERREPRASWWRSSARARSAARWPRTSSPKMFASGEAAAAIVEREGLRQISDTARARKDRRRSDGRESQTGGAVPRRQDHRARASWWAR